MVVLILVILGGLTALIFAFEGLEFSVKINALAFLGNSILYVALLCFILDVLLLVSRKNVVYLSVISTCLLAVAWYVLDYAFINNYVDFEYVWNYTNTSVPLVYKIVAIWAGQAGSILTWALFAAITVSLFRAKSRNLEENPFFSRAIIPSLITMVVLLVVLMSLDPFRVSQPFIAPQGRGLSSILMSPYLIWHPFFMFVSYAVFQVPFFMSLAEIVSRTKTGQAHSDTEINKVALRAGWLVLSLGIGLGAYWASLSTGWGRYWGWDPIETVSLVPWIFATASFHTRGFKHKTRTLVHVNLILIFLSIILATVITRGGSLASIHAFVSPLGGSIQADRLILIMLAFFIEIIVLVLVLYLIYNVIEKISEDYANRITLFDDLTHLFLIILAFICVLGLSLPTISFIAYGFDADQAIFVGTEFFSQLGMICAVGLAISMNFCALIPYWSVKKISTLIFSGFAGSLVFTAFYGATIFGWIDLIAIFYILALIATIFNLIKNFRRRSISDFVKTNAKTVIHIGLSAILLGTLSVSPSIFQDICYIGGFFIMISGSILGILSRVLKRKQVQVTSG